MGVEVVWRRLVGFLGRSELRWVARVLGGVGSAATPCGRRVLLLDRMMRRTLTGRDPDGGLARVCSIAGENGRHAPYVGVHDRGGVGHGTLLYRGSSHVACDRYGCSQPLKERSVVISRSARQSRPQ